MKKVQLTLILLLLSFGKLNTFSQTINETFIPGENVFKKAISLPKAKFSENAKIFCASGEVRVEILINDNNEVIAAKAVSGDKLLWNSAVKAAIDAKFIQTSFLPSDKGNGTIIYNFVSQNKCINVGIINDRALDIPKPQNTITAQQKYVQSKKDQFVAVQIVVDSSGKVIGAKAISGHWLFRSDCENAARQVKFSSTAIDAQPVNVKGLIVYKIKPDGTVETNIKKDDKDVIGTPITLVEPPPPFCNCRFGTGKPSVFVEAIINEDGSITAAKAYSGHPILKYLSEKAALESKFLPANIKAKISIIYQWESISDGREAKFTDVKIKDVKIEK